jgi:hypothetical protein
MIARNTTIAQDMIAMGAAYRGDSREVFTKE